MLQNSAPAGWRIHPNSSIWAFKRPRPSPVSAISTITESRQKHTLVLLCTCEISPKYRCTEKSTNSQAALAHFLGGPLDQGVPLWSVTAAGAAEGRSFKARRSRHVCDGHRQLPTGFGIFLWSTSVCNQDPFGMGLDHHRRAKTR